MTVNTCAHHYQIGNGCLATDHYYNDLAGRGHAKNYKPSQINLVGEWKKQNWWIM